MRVLLAEQAQIQYAELLTAAAPQLQLVCGDEQELARQAASCPVWLGQPDLLAPLLRPSTSQYFVRG